MFGPAAETKWHPGGTKWSGRLTCLARWTSRSPSRTHQGAHHGSHDGATAALSPATSALGKPRTVDLSGHLRWGPATA